MVLGLGRGLELELGVGVGVAACAAGTACGVGRRSSTYPLIAPMDRAAAGRAAGVACPLLTPTAGVAGDAAAGEAGMVSRLAVVNRQSSSKAGLGKVGAAWIGLGLGLGKGLWLGLGFAFTFGFAFGFGLGLGLEG